MRQFTFGLQEMTLKSLKVALQELVDSADQEGCSDDLCVVSTEAIRSLCEAAGSPVPMNLRYPKDE